jgi:hypothetical protein
MEEKMIRAIVVGLLMSTSPALAADDVLIRYMDTVLDFVANMSASCALHYEDGLTPKARAELNFSKSEIGAYCVCSTKLLIREMEGADFQNLAAGTDLPMKFAPILKQARFDCAKKIWEVRKRR